MLDGPLRNRGKRLKIKCDERCPDGPGAQSPHEWRHERIVEQRFLRRSHRLALGHALALHRVDDLDRLAQGFGELVEVAGFVGETRQGFGHLGQFAGNTSLLTPHPQQVGSDAVEFLGRKSGRWDAMLDRDPVVFAVLPDLVESADVEERQALRRHAREVEQHPVGDHVANLRRRVERHLHRLPEGVKLAELVEGLVVGPLLAHPYARGTHDIVVDFLAYHETAQVAVPGTIGHPAEVLGHTLDGAECIIGQHVHTVRNFLGPGALLGVRHGLSAAPQCLGLGLEPVGRDLARLLHARRRPLDDTLGQDPLGILGQITQEIRHGQVARRLGDRLGHEKAYVLDLAQIEIAVFLGQVRALLEIALVADLEARAKARALHQVLEVDARQIGVGVRVVGFLGQHPAAHELTADPLDG